MIADRYRSSMFAAKMGKMPLSRILLWQGDQRSAQYEDKPRCCQYSRPAKSVNMAVT